MTADFEKATTEKLLCQQEADATNATIQLANRLVGGLASENVRWAEAVNKLVKINVIVYVAKVWNQTQPIGMLGWLFTCITKFNSALPLQSTIYKFLFPAS